MNQHIPATAATTRRDTGLHRAAPRRIEASRLPLPPNPFTVPVYAGNLGPGTWVVEVAAGVVPVGVARNAVAVLAGFLPPHTYVTPVGPAPADIEDSPGWGPPTVAVRTVA